MKHNEHPPDLESLVFSHKSVLVNECVEALAIMPGTVIVDATFGGGGHTRAILQSDPTVRVIGLDWDALAIKKNAPFFTETFGTRVTLLWGNFANLDVLLKKAGVSTVQGILADLGTSQFQIHHREGFSFAHDTPLDMRMSNAHSYVTAAEILAKMSEKDLADIFWAYGEERFSRRIARAIVATRVKAPLKTTKQLADLVARAVPAGPYKKRSFPIHPATKVFQALRIHVNHELEHLETFIKQAAEALTPGGRLAIISFHSLEDRIVKHALRELPDQFEILTKKPITATPEEIAHNPSSRSAKLRVAKKL